MSGGIGAYHPGGGALAHWGHWGIGALGALARWRIGALVHWGITLTLTLNQVISELMRESADLPDLVQARLIPNPNPEP